MFSLSSTSSLFRTLMMDDEGSDGCPSDDNLPLEDIISLNERFNPLQAVVPQQELAQQEEQDKEKAERGGGGGGEKGGEKGERRGSLTEGGKTRAQSASRAREDSNGSSSNTPSIPRYMMPKQKPRSSTEADEEKDKEKEREGGGTAGKEENEKRGGGTGERRGSKGEVGGSGGGGGGGEKRQREGSGSTYVKPDFRGGPGVTVMLTSSLRVSRRVSTESRDRARPQSERSGLLEYGGQEQDMQYDEVSRE